MGDGQKGLRRHLAALALLALLCSSVSFRTIPATSDDLPAESAVSATPGSDPAGSTDPVGQSAEPGAGVAAPPLGPVEVQRAGVRVDGVGDGALETALGMEGVSFATVVAVADTAVGEPGGGRIPLRVAMVDPAGFRVLTPQVTADALDLWERLSAGEAVFTHEHAQRLALQLGSHVPFGDHQTAVRVGAFATHATPPVADAIVSMVTGELLGLGAAPRSLLVALTADARPDDVARALERTLGAPAHVIVDPRVPRVLDFDGRMTVWDRLALCESSGDWHINTGNGYYGGLQFLPESWFLVGGTGMPHEATREEQIARAERLLAIQGWEAWPVCSILLGLRPGPLPERYRNDPADGAAPAPPPDPQAGPSAGAPEAGPPEDAPPAGSGPEEGPLGGPGPTIPPLP
ncbi:MAG TPA: transglycosylase family protein [Egibacteraceae bacterium]|nr:transglycosylase family protein [Egibacteraceae bacterium]